MKTKIRKYILLTQNRMNKTILRNSILIILTMTALQEKAQLIFPCTSTTGIVLTALNSQGLSNPTYSMDPGGITSPNPTFTVMPSSNTTYTLYVSGTNSNSAPATTSSTIMVALPPAPIYTVVSPQSFSLGCGVKSTCTINITDAQSTIPPGGGAVCYTLLPPGISTAAIPSGSLSGINSYTINTPGPWVVGVRDKTNGCTTWSVITVSQNTVLPSIGYVSVSQNPLTCTSPTALLQVSPNSAIQYYWNTIGQPGVQGNNIIVTFSNTSAAFQPTLIATDVNNACISQTVIAVNHNNYPPVAVINAPPQLPGICQSTVVFSNNSTSGIPNGTYPNSAPVVASLWEGPVPQPTAAFTSAYLAQTSGVYTMTAMDMNNGCTSTTIYTVKVGPSAAFLHTITGGQASFNNVSTNISGNTNYLWDFGDGNTSTLQNPSHLYQNAGAYLVKLKVKNPGVCTDSIIQAVNISGVPCIANSNFSMVPTGTAQVWNIVPAYPWNVTAASWSWGDGSFSNTLYSSHHYSAAGMYTICLSVTVSCSASSSACTSYSIYRVTEEAQILEVNVIAPGLISGLASAEASEEFSWSIAPNPNSGSFNLTINHTKPKPARVLISDLSGRIVYDQSIAPESNSQLVHTGNLSSGLYLVTLDYEGVKVTKRMIVNQ